MQWRFQPEYPHKDETGQVWIDPGGMLVLKRAPCFWCGRLTRRVDVDFGGPFCNSVTCNAEIAADLLRLGMDDRLLSELTRPFKPDTVEPTQKINRP
jgi:hypothetical protein